MKITTNNHCRMFLYRNEVPEKILQSEFDWIDESDIDYFFKYRGSYYHLSEFQILTKTDPDFVEWDAIHVTSAWDAIVIKVSECQELYKIGHATW